MYDETTIHISCVGMTMFAYIFVLGCACALAEGNNVAPPPYVEALKMSNQVVGVLQKNVLSMASGIPLLADPRRHYVEVVWNIWKQAEHLVKYIGSEYDSSYPTVLNETAALAIVNPQMVVDDTAKSIKHIMESTHNIRSLIEIQCKKTRPRDCDQVIDDEVKADPNRYRKEAEVLLSAGGAAAKFMEMEPSFEKVARDHAAHKYVVEGQKLLKELVSAVAELMPPFIR